jgi:hypothetical protein
LLAPYATVLPGRTVRSKRLALRPVWEELELVRKLQLAEAQPPQLRRLNTGEGVVAP